MRIVGFNFTKISAEKVNESAKDVKINSNIDISKIDSLKTDVLKTREDLLGISFTHTVNYAPDFANLEVKGVIIIALEPKLAKNVLKDWKEKKLDEEIRVPLFNLILKRSALKLLPLEGEMNIPLHLPLPSFKKEDAKK